MDVSMATTRAAQGGGRREGHEDSREDEPGGDRENSGRHGDDGDSRVTMTQALRAAAGQLAELLGTEPGAVSALKPTESGWCADVEIVEIARIPDTTSVMASYRVELDRRGQITGYERTRRYARGRVDR
jgi:Gas vesicle synthesis protein GvpO